MSKILEAADRIPWWGRIWRTHWDTDQADILPIPICYLARFIWNLWCFSFRFRRNEYEGKLHQAYIKGLMEGKKANFRRTIIEQNIDIMLDLLNRGANLDNLSHKEILLSILPEEEVDNE